jgi:tRNA pseudouridine55 synthase
VTADGLLVVDKPPAWTSHDVVARVRRLAGTRRVGHAGTLDPMATGVLVLGLNRGTKLLTYLVGADKDYDATIRLGEATVTDDAEGEIIRRPGAPGLDRAAVLEAVAGFVGAIEQVPSAVSAIKVDGRRAYARVRAGEDVTLPARPVTIHQYDVLETRATLDGETPVLDVDVRVTCSSGTYIRALARDLGDVLGVGGHLTALRRTRVGEHGISTAVTLEQVERDGVHVVPLAAAARATLAAREITADEAIRLGHGNRIAAGGAAPGQAEPVAAFAPDGTLVAIVQDRGTSAVPLLVLAPL